MFKETVVDFHLATICPTPHILARGKRNEQINGKDLRPKALEMRARGKVEQEVGREGWEDEP